MQQRSTVPFGPQHPVFPEPIQFKITYVDEKVAEVVPALGYGHRGIEKACELNDFVKNIYLCERVCGICSAVHGITYCEAVEKLWPLDIPPRAKYLRTIWSEMSRTHSHLLTLGLFADTFGFESMFMQFWRIREKVLDILEMTAGHRVTQSVSIIGGVRRDISQEQKKKCIEVLKEVKCDTEKLINVIMNDYTVKGRTIGVGTMSSEQSILLGCVGPMARGSGVKEDCRMLKYQAYGDLEYEPIIETAGDSYARCMVRARETLQAIDLQLEAFGKIPEGELSVKPKGNPPANEATSRIEQPRGELFYYVKGNNTKNLDRVRVRTPTYSNIPALLVLLPGTELPDVPIIVHSIDPCISCTER